MDPQNNQHALICFAGGCHCGEVRFEVLAPNQVEVEDCNCSICNKTGFLHLIVPASQFKLLSPEAKLSCYQFNTGVAKHYFYKRCGVKAFYIPRSNPDGVDVNVRCLDTLPDEINIVKFDGDNWEDNAAALVHKSKLPSSD